MSAATDPDAGAAPQVRPRGQMWRAALDLVFPPLCVACRRPVAAAHNLCADCWSKVSFIDGPECAQCGLPFEIDPGPGTLCAACHAKPPAFDRVRSVMRYDDASKAPILAFKRADRLDIVPAFARWLARSGRPLIEQADLIVPVPLHRTRLWSRRFNQAALLANALSRISGVPTDPLLLMRIRATESQGVMPSASARRRNVQGAFKVASGRELTIRERTVLVVDDVFTTGATLESCAKALKRAGAARVLALTLARVVRAPTYTI